MFKTLLAEPANTDCRLGPWLGALAVWGEGDPKLDPGCVDTPIASLCDTIDNALSSDARKKLIAPRMWDPIGSRWTRSVTRRRCQMLIRDIDYNIEYDFERACLQILRLLRNHAPANQYLHVKNWVKRASAIFGGYRDEATVLLSDHRTAMSAVCSCMCFTITCGLVGEVARAAQQLWEYGECNIDPPAITFFCASPVRSYDACVYALTRAMDNYVVARMFPLLDDLLSIGRKRRVVRKCTGTQLRGVVWPSE